MKLLACYPACAVKQCSFTGGFVHLALLLLAALGSTEGTCYTVSDQINVGDGHTVCGEEEVRRRTLNTGYTVSALPAGMKPAAPSAA